MENGGAPPKGGGGRAPEDAQEVQLDLKGRERGDRVRAEEEGGKRPITDLSLIM